MTCLALLLAGGDKVDGAVVEGCGLCLGKSHVAGCVFFLRCLIPVAGVALVLQLVEGLQLQGVPLAFVLVVHDIYIEDQRVLRLADQRKHIVALANEQG